MLTAIFLAAAVAADPTALHGRVTDGEGNPVAGARVDIYTAKPLQGASVVCPSCYLDCDKWTETDQEGRFVIKNLDPTLQFRVLVMAEGLKPAVTEHLDPWTNTAEVALEPLPGSLPPDRVLRGRIVGPDGEPIAGVVVEPWGAKTASRRWWGSLPGVDAAAVTDADGRFVITSRDPKLGMDLRVTAPGFAVELTDLFEMGETVHEIRLEMGVTVTGQIVYDGEPLAGRAVGAVQEDRSAHEFVGDLVIGTDSEGRFTLNNLQPNQRYVVYTLCDGTTPGPALPATAFETQDDGAAQALGPLDARPGLTLAGTVELPDGARLPEAAKITLFRNPAWNHCSVGIEPNGSFHFVGLAPEVYKVRVNLPGYDLDTSNLRFQPLAPQSFGLRMREDREGVIVPMLAR